MAKQTGLGDNLYCDEFDLSGDTGSLSNIGGGPNALDTTSIVNRGFFRLGGIRDGRIEWSSWFNPSEDQEHAALSGRPVADRQVSYLRGTGVGSPVAMLLSKQLNYDPTRNADGSLSIALSAQSNGFGIEWGEQLTDSPEDVSAVGALTSLDYGATIGTTAFGLQAYLHILEFTGTDIDVAVQHSDDDGGTDPYADITGAVFTTATAVGHERVQTARDASIKRWLRVNLGGTFTSATLMVGVVKNRVQTDF